MRATRSVSDKRILRAIRQDYPEGWEQFYHIYAPVIQSVLEWPRWHFTRHEKEDVRQNIYLSLQKSIPSFRGESSLQWFIICIAQKQCASEVRRQVRHRIHTVPIEQRTSRGEINEREFACPRTLDPHNEVLRQEQKQAVLSSLKKLQEICQTSIFLFYVESLSYQEISKRLGIAVNTVGSRLSKCLDKLHKELRKHPLFEREIL